jgi:hypothetical protein
MQRADRSHLSEACCYQFKLLVKSISCTHTIKRRVNLQRDGVTVLVLFVLRERLLHGALHGGCGAPRSHKPKAELLYNQATIATSRLTTSAKCHLCFDLQREGRAPHLPSFEQLESNAETYF